MDGRSPIVLLGLTLLLVAPALAGCVSPAATEPSTARELRVEQVPEGARVSWVEFPTGIAVKYLVYRNGDFIAEVTPPQRHHTDRDVRPNAAYSYQVSTLTGAGREGPLSDAVTFRLERTMAVQQDGLLDRGFANFTIVQVSPGIRFADLTLLVGGHAVPLDDGAYLQSRESWTHSNSRDPLVDRGDQLHVYAPDVVRRNATFEVRLADGTALAHDLLKGRPTLNLTLRQERNATEGLASLQVIAHAWHDGARDVSASYPALAPRFNALEVRVDGVVLPMSTDGRVESWSRESPSDVVRDGARINLRSSLLVPGALVVVMDAEMREESFRLVLK